MKKLFLAALCVVGNALGVFAQGEIAVLLHDGQLSAFYGKSALGAAQQEAEDGDVITLSNGTFDVTIVERAVTFRGVGMEEDVATGRPATIVKAVRGGWYVGMDIGQLMSEKSATFEGICFDNCDFPVLGYAASITLDNCKVIHSHGIFSSGPTTLQDLTLKKCFIWIDEEEFFTPYAQPCVHKEFNVSNCIFKGLGTWGHIAIR